METIIPPPVDSSTKDKIPKVRSVAYPSYTIDHCVSLTETIYKLFGNSISMPIEKIAEKTGISTSYLQQQLSSCVQYGLLELKSKDGYKATSLFIKIYKPLPNEVVTQSKKEAFCNPELYIKIIEGYNNSTMTIDGLATLMYRSLKVSENASQKAAGIFIQNATDIGLINIDNFFSIDETVKDTDQVEFEELKDKNDGTNVKFLPLPKPPDDSGKPKVTNFPPIQVVLDDGNISETYLPNGFKKSDIERIIKVLSAYIA